ncbi:uncharacterized protein NPIL_418511 [Nephila pilipes]|uniref:Adenomatous polyposis coli protein n=1 Tax=Nephila pilipes TaxID=299642 RepID=A0A8X6MES9_NEPPI|nr:uncharacterized protein NPIL_418511 [Nephila pilipes]
MQPSYNYYIETDLDTVNDQLVDYSKRYADQDSDDVCCSTPGKKRHHSPPLANSVTIKQSYDEVKVYCMEGTPLMISSASSMCDLREVDITEQGSESITSKTGKRHCFSPSPRCSNVDQEVHEKKSIANVNNDELLSIQCEEKESGKRDEENTVQEIEANCTKSSSPLMFSRTSSISSLNSFEQHSIVDDRSSVSAFSTLTSGIISPSEIPDSPGEAISPFINKNKQNEFQFPSNEKSMDPVLAKLKSNPTEHFMDEDLSEDDIKVFDDEGDCPSVSNLSALSIQADSACMSISIIQHKNECMEAIHKSSVNTNCEVASLNTSFVVECNNEQLNTSDEVYEHDCNFSSLVNINTVLIKKYSQNENLKDHNNYNMAKGEITCEKKGGFNEGDNNYSTSSEADDAALKEISGDMLYLQESESADYSKDISDEECDALIEECILSGMPRKIDSDHNLSKQSLNNSYQSNDDSESKIIATQPNCSYSDNDVSDDENIEIMDECIQLGMPQKSSSPHIQDKVVNSSDFEAESLNKKHLNVSSRMLPISSKPMQEFNNYDALSSQNIEKSHESSSSESMLLNLCINLGKPATIQEEDSIMEKRPSLKSNLLTENQIEDVDEKELCKSDEELDIDESELLVQQCIQLGMPKSQLRNSKNTKASKKFYAFNKELGYRDNRPDGISDAEDDDDIVTECIKAGMPSSKSSLNGADYSLQNKNRRFKPLNQRKLTVAEAQLLRKDCYGNLQEDSMCIYRTEDTPILSPSASLSDLSTLSFADDKICLNNSRNSLCSSESEDDELLLQCIRSGMPGAKRVAV